MAWPCLLLQPVKCYIRRKGIGTNKDNHMPRKKSDSDVSEEVSEEHMQAPMSHGSATFQQTNSQTQRTSPPNHIFVGKKPVMSYAMSALIQLTQAGEVVVKARGMAIRGSRRCRDCHKAAGQWPISNQGYWHQHRSCWRGCRTEKHFLNRDSRRQVVHHGSSTQSHTRLRAVS